MTRRYYDWHATFSRQVGTDGEFCIVVGAKNIGKTFGLRLQCVRDYIRRGDRFCEICRTKDEMRLVKQGYFDKLKECGKLDGYIFKVEGQVGFCAKEPPRDPETGDYEGKPQWGAICYFVALTAFQTEKKRTYSGIRRYIFDEAVIDRKDRYHRYLPNEFLILANILDSISRQQPDGERYRVYLLGNACDLTCPYLRNLGIDKVPEFGYSFWNKRNTLLHYVEPWDAEQMEAQTLVGRMLRGNAEASMVYRNVFDDGGDSGTISKKTSAARFAFAVRFAGETYAAWVDYGQGMCYITSRVPKGTPKGKMLTVTRSDARLDYQAVERASPYLQALNSFFYSGLLRYESPVLRESFLTLLGYLGIK